jgi:hypothetical protein
MVTVPLHIDRRPIVCGSSGRPRVDQPPRRDASGGMGEDLRGREQRQAEERFWLKRKLSIGSG